MQPSQRRPLPALGELQPPGPWMAELPASRAGTSSGRVPALDRGQLEQLRAHAEAVRQRNIQGGRRSLSSGCSTPCSMVTPAPPRAMQRRGNVSGAPWQSYAVQRFAARLTDPELARGAEKPAALMLEGPQGVALQAVGEAEDHKAASKTVAEFMKGSEKRASSMPSATSLVKVVPGHQAPIQPRGKVAFGAVYEHRDCFGKPRLIGHTDVVPERQFQLDHQEHRDVQQLAKQGAPGASGHLVWVGVGAGVVGEAEMLKVREAVVEARSQRLQIDKLSSIKPYSSHF